jgi:iron complex transport system ATP-binding protein
MNSAALQIQDLSVRAGRKTILAIESLSLVSGGLLAVMGPNGAGKTTLLRTCLGMQPGVQGHICVLGQSLSSASLTHLRRSIGYVPQMLPVRSEMPLTVREVVSIGRTGLAGLFRPLSSHDWHVVDEWIEQLGLAPLASCAFHELSGGEQRKTVIARAMAQQPQLLLLDEPTANLDLGWRERIVATIQSLYEQTKLTVLLVCHELEVLPACCGRVVLLNKGQAVADGSPQSVFTSQRISDLYGANLTAVHSHGRHAVIPAGGKP